MRPRRSNRRQFRKRISDACDDLGCAQFGEILREHGMREFLMNERLDEMNPQQFFIHAISELILIGKTHNNCAICIAALGLLLWQLHAADSKWRDDYAMEVFEITKAENVKKALIAWIQENFP